MKWKRDIGLTMRVIMTWALLLLVYLIFLTVLGALFPGIGMWGLFAIGFVMAFGQYLYSDRLVLWSRGARGASGKSIPNFHHMAEKVCPIACATRDGWSLL